MDLKEIFDKVKGEFDSILKEFEQKIVKEEWTDGEYYNIEPYQIERLGCDKGKILDSKPKLTKDQYCYCYDSENRIVMVKQGIDIADQFFYRFLSYSDNNILSYEFGNSGNITNVRYFNIDNNLITKLESKGRRGSKKQLFNYDSSNLLTSIETRQFDRRGNEADPFKEEFEYEDGILLTITKSFPNGYSEVTYENKILKS